METLWRGTEMEENNDGITGGRTGAADAEVEAWETYAAEVCQRCVEHEGWFGGSI
jgi:hypothetical protein